MSQNLHFFGSPDGYSVRSTFEGVIGSPFSAIGCRARSTIPSCDSGSVVFGKFRATCQKICEADKQATGLPARMIAELFWLAASFQPRDRTLRRQNRVEQSLRRMCIFELALEYAVFSLVVFALLEAIYQVIQKSKFSKVTVYELITSSRG